MEENKDVNLQRETGDGTREKPFMIFDAEGLRGMGENLSAFYRLAGDIDLKGGTVTPVGTIKAAFTGGLDGDGYAISNFKINTAGDYTGLIGYGRNAELKKLRLENGEITSSGSYIGALAGYMNGGSVSECFADVHVKGNSYVGGLVGFADKDTGVSDSYVAGSVASTTKTYTGGLIGCACYAAIQNCYTACRLNLNSMGIATIRFSATVVNCFFDSLLSEFGLSDEYNTGKLTMAMTKKRLYTGWDFENVWDIEEDGTYPFLRIAGRTAAIAADRKYIAGGIGTTEEPYPIWSAETFEHIKYDLAGCYRLTADIDLNGRTVAPIGRKAVPFKGALYGEGYRIKNYKISAEGDDAGLFAYAKGAVFKNIRLQKGEVESAQGNHVGGLAGTMEECTAEDVTLSEFTVSGNILVGILTGYAFGGSFTGCRARQGFVSGTQCVGGLMGRMSNNRRMSYIKECCAEGSVSGSEKVGGLIGANSATINDCYAMGGVTGTSHFFSVGGLVGDLSGGYIRRSYAACSVTINGSGLEYCGGAESVKDSYYDCVAAELTVAGIFNIGKLTSCMTRKKLYKNWDFETVWNIEEGMTYPYLRSAGKPAGPPKAFTPVEGSGTPEEPYLIGDAASFLCIRYEPSGCYRLTADIDLEGETVLPAGTKAMRFTGTLEGEGHTVKNFTITSQTPDTGLIGYAYRAHIRDIKLENGTVTSTSTQTGALAGSMVECVVENVGLSGISVSGDQDTGALVGKDSGGNYTRCCAAGITVSGKAQAGGLIGWASATLNECYARGSVTGQINVGGLLGYGSMFIKNCYTAGSVTSTDESEYTGGLAGFSQGISIINSYTACKISKNGKGLIYWGNAESSYFDSALAGTAEPERCARTPEQMLKQETYAGWDWDGIWKWKEGAYPGLKNVETVNREPFELAFQKSTYDSVAVEWPDIQEAKGYKILYENQVQECAGKEALISGLCPDTDYVFRVCADMGNGARLWSKPLKIRTNKFYIHGLHCTGKGPDSVTLTWDPAEGAAGYEVCCDGRIQETAANTCTVEGLSADRPYGFSVRALPSDGGGVEGGPVVEKIYALNPQTDYAKEWIGKCEGQTWFMDEVERLLNQKGKSINTIASREDFSCIFALGLADRGISGHIPPAVGELTCLRYLYLAGNELSGELPKELETLENLIETDL